MLGHSRPCNVTMDGYSRSAKFTGTHFHHPTRRYHCTSQYEIRHGNRTFTDNFRTKAKAAYNQYQHPSYGHRPPPAVGRNDKLYSNTQKKATVPPRSNAPTDPLAMTYEALPQQPLTRAAFSTTYLYKAQVERQHYLPAQRQLARTHKNYHARTGMQTQRPSKQRIRQGLNSSLQMQSTLEYWGHPTNTMRGSLDDLRYASRK